ncbi:MAG: hypothetical protein WC471_05040 [Candidatus Woesearchaeota archaeon]
MKDKLFYMGIFVYIFAFLYFYPSFFSIADENAYLAGISFLTEGEVSTYDIFKSYYSADLPDSDKFVPAYQLGNSVIILPFAMIDWRLIFLSGLIFHLLNLWIFVKILKKYGLNKRYGLLYLLYPGFIFYSRTVMSEIPTITFTLLGFYFYLSEKKNSKLLAGLMLGISCLLRLTNGLLLIGFMIIPLYKTIRNLFKGKSWFNKDIKLFLEIFTGALPSLLLILAFNYFAYDGIFNTRYAGGGTNVYYYMLGFGISKFSNLMILWKPLLILCTIYPLMGISPFLGKYNKKAEIILITILSLLVFGKIDVFRYSWLINFTVGHRYFFSIIPLLLIPYSLFLNKYFKKLVSISIISLMIITPLIMYEQSLYTDTKYEVMKQIYAVVPDSELIVIEGDPQYLNYFFGNNSIMRFHNSNQLDFSKQFYLVEFGNQDLMLNLKNVGELQDLEHERDAFSEFIEITNTSIIYNHNNLRIYSNLP